MNLTGYKRSKRGMKAMLNDELAKKRDKCEPKIDRLWHCISDCSIKIKELQEARKAKKKVK